jgi:uncharacterized protein with NRDE domain
MCTVSWLKQDAGYVVLFNRDERHSRLPALPPTFFTHDGTTICAPRDGDFGGTWIGLNEFGISVGLLNRYEDDQTDSAAHYSTRGEIAIELLAASTLEEVQSRFQRLKVAAYRPFSLFAIAPGQPVFKADWNGRSLTLNPYADQASPLVSSSYDTTRACATRRATYQTLTHQGVTLDTLIRFHSSHFPESGPYSTCMHRADAQTVSFTIIMVGPDGAAIRYTPGPPCVTQAETVIREFSPAEVA